MPDGADGVLPAEVLVVGVAVQRAGTRAVVARGVLGVEPDLDRVAARVEVVLDERQLGALGDRELQRHEVDAPHLLGDRVLDLQAGVHLEEEEPPVVVEEELHRPDPDVAELLGEPDGRGAHARPQVLVDDR